MRFLTLAVMLALTASCTDLETAERLASLEKRLTALERNDGERKSTVEYLDSRLTFAESNIASNARARSAAFSPNEKGFSAIHTDYGFFLVSLQNVQQYANGYKVTLNLGNPQNLNFTGIKIGLRWGPETPKEGFAKFPGGHKAWQDKFRKSEEKINRPIAGGRWNPVEVILAPASADDIGTIEVTSIETDQVSLIR